MRKMLAVATLCGAVAFLHSGDAGAQCAARDVLQKVTIAKSTLAPATSTETVHGVWKTITLGRFANTFALRNALDAAGCGVGDLAGEVLARPTFVLNPSNSTLTSSLCPLPSLAWRVKRRWRTSTRARKNAALRLRRPKLVRSCDCNTLINQSVNFSTSE